MQNEIRPVAQHLERPVGFYSATALWHWPLHTAVQENITQEIQNALPKLNSSHVFASGDNITPNPDQDSASLFPSCSISGSNLLFSSLQPPQAPPLCRHFLVIPEAAEGAAAAAVATDPTESWLSQGDSNAFECFFAAELAGAFIIRRARSAAAAES